MSLGVYLHVPFCRSICPYCAFNVTARRGPLPAEALGDAMIRQLDAMAHLYRGPLYTVYFGGGTPSLLEPAFFARMLVALRRRFDARALHEVTVEVEPNTSSLAALRELRALGVNRLSIGWQSGQNSVLARLGRRHRAEDTDRLIDTARKAGFANISVDWLIAAPGQTESEFSADLAAVVRLPVAHVSCYLLTIEEKTGFARALARGQLTEQPDEIAASWLTRAAAGLQRAGFARYEVANFARPGCMSAHNRAYWSHRPYLGLGPGAHSMASVKRRIWRWQMGASIGAYLKSATKPPVRLQLGQPADPKITQPGEPFVQNDSLAMCEQLSQEQVAVETIMLSLRRPSGLSLASPRLSAFRAPLAAASEQLKALGYAQICNGRIRPTALGLLHADRAALLLMAAVNGEASPSLA